MIDNLEDILYVPIHAVTSKKGDRVCHLADGSVRVVETGEYNDKYIEIVSGLNEADVVLLNPPKSEDEHEVEEESEVERDKMPAPPPPPGPKA